MISTNALFFFVQLRQIGSSERHGVIHKQLTEVTNMNEKELLHTPEGLAAMLKVTENALGIWRHNGTGPKYLRISRRAIRYSNDAVQEWLQEKEVA